MEQRTRIVEMAQTAEKPRARSLEEPQGRMLEVAEVPAQVLEEQRPTREQDEELAELQKELKLVI